MSFQNELEEGERRHEGEPAALARVECSICMSKPVQVGSILRLCFTVVF